MKQRIYIETTIPSFFYTLLTDTESLARRQWTREWWAAYASASELVTSPAVIEELEVGTGEQTENRLMLLGDLEVLEINSDIRDIARVYIERLLMPNDPTGDALHLAVATYYRVDVLLTWNCRHLANPNKMQHLRVVNFGLGYPSPIVTTPMNFLSGGDADG